nr:putative reverse transcriptase domain-containing protein [Tanacetum cinerariifolium]
MPFWVNQCTSGFHGLNEPGSRGSFEVGVGAAKEAEVVCQVFQKELNTLQRRWIELFSDFNSEIRYHPRKESVLAEALSGNERVKPRQVENAIAEMLHGLDQLMERKEDGDRDGRFTSRVLENITVSHRDAIGYEYGLTSSDRWTKSPVSWDEIGESRLIGLELVQEMTDKKYLADANLLVRLEEIKVDKTLRFVEEPIEIIDHEDRMSMPTQWEQMGMPTQCDMLCDTFWASLVAYSASYSNPEWEIMFVNMLI